ncbi:MAG: ParB/RepB/Spo0J family partition protein [Candidatus Cloacimonadaceae bacterium]
MNEKLGRGLSALIPDTVDESTPNQGGIGILPVARIRANRYQPRKSFDVEKLRELSQSILENGIIQPLIVTKSEGSDYELIAGERRLEAAKLAGLESVPVVIRSVSEKEQLQMAIIENVQREDLDPIEEALAYQTMAEDFELTHAQIAQIIGKDRATISNSLRLLKLPAEVIEMIAASQLSAGHGRAILMAKEELQLPFAQHILKYQLNVRQAEGKAKDFSLQENRAAEKRYSDNSRFLEQEFRKIFNLRVKVQESRGKGKITLEYNNPYELEQIIETLEKMR